MLHDATTGVAVAPMMPLAAGVDWSRAEADLDAGIWVLPDVELDGTGRVDAAGSTASEADEVLSFAPPPPPPDVPPGSVVALSTPPPGPDSPEVAPASPPVDGAEPVSLPPPPPVPAVAVAVAVAVPAAPPVAEPAVLPPPPPVPVEAAGTVPEPPTLPYRSERSSARRVLVVGAVAALVVIALGVGARLRSADDPRRVAFGLPDRVGELELQPGEDVDRQLDALLAAVPADERDDLAAALAVGRYASDSRAAFVFVFRGDDRERADLLAGFDAQLREADDPDGRGAEGAAVVSVRDHDLTARCSTSSELIWCQVEDEPLVTLLATSAMPIDEAGALALAAGRDARR
ncbi:MAG: hypothetical protein OEY23_20015 [Acidimicrobiia bacterium]|nr:hypothetical protein [Acidimicrobiia bacterium]